MSAARGQRQMPAFKHRIKIGYAMEDNSTTGAVLLLTILCNYAETAYTPAASESALSISSKRSAKLIS